MSTKEPETREDPDVLLNEADCFGWFSPVHTKCQHGSCMLSERCKHHTIQVQHTSSTLDELPNPFKNNTTEKREQVKAVEQPVVANNKGEELFSVAFFEQVVNHSLPLITHDDVHRNSSMNTVSVKKEGQVNVIFYRNKKNFIVAVRNKQGRENEIREEFLFDDVDKVKKQVATFIRREHKR